MHKLNFFFFRIFVGIIGVIPFPVLYFFSNIFAWKLHSVFGYRKKVVYKNLRNSFPDKTEKEIKRIAKAFYRNLSDVILEGIKGFTMSADEANKRYIWKNPEVANRYFYEGKHVIGLASHFANWEWGTQTIGHQLLHRTLGIVKLVKNPLINNFLQKTRCAKNVFVADISQTRTSIETFTDKPTLFVFISDQSPRNVEKAQWVQFLNQKTPCLYGADRLAREKNWPVVNIQVNRLKRGFYEVQMELLEETPSETNDGDITIKYMKALESQIISQSEYWLWSHRRWKRI